MQHPFLILKPEYDKLLASMRVTLPMTIETVAQRLVGSKGNMVRCQQVAAEIAVPAALIMALDYRESDANPTRALGQGDLWNRVSTHVPVGKGPFPSWKDAAEFYLQYDHVDDATQPWSWPYVCWKAEAYNGFGPRNHGKFSGYLWNGTNIYTGGKYVADGVWDPNAHDEQLGVIPLMRRLTALRSELSFEQSPALDHVASPPVAPEPAPLGVGAAPTETHDVRWLQNSLNHAYLTEDGRLTVDGSYGRRTREAVRSFQRFNQLEPDGLFGPKTDAALTEAMGVQRS